MDMFDAFDAFDQFDKFQIEFIDYKTMIITDEDFLQGLLFY